MSLRDMFVWCETLSLTSSLVTGLPFSDVDDIQMTDGERAAAHFELFWELFKQRKKVQM